MYIKKKIPRLISTLLSFSMVFSNVIPVYAVELVTIEKSVDTESDGETNEENFEEIEVTYKQSSSYFVTIPKTIALDGWKQAAYSVKVTGDIAAEQCVYVAPIDAISDTENVDFYMKDQASDNQKADVVATVAQSKFHWNSEEVADGYEETNNSVSAYNLTAGTWKGIFQMEIRLESHTTHVHNYINGKCECGEIDPDHTHNYKDGTCTICGKNHEHNYVGGKCECGEIDPNHEHNFVDGTCTICGEKNPNANPYEVAPEGAYSNWNYTLDNNNNIITLNYYIGSEADIIVYSNYEVNGTTYKTQIKSNKYSNVDNRSYYMFDSSNKTYGYDNTIKTITFGDNIDTSSCTDMSFMFTNCFSLTSINLGNNFDTSHVTNMQHMFAGCKSLESIEGLNNFDTRYVTNMCRMFDQCPFAELDLSGFNTSKVTDMSYMFCRCSNLKTIYVTNGEWSTLKATVTGMFTSCGTSSVTYK